MQVALSELKINVGKYVDQSEREDIYITRNGKQVAKIVNLKRDKVKDMKTLFGAAVLPAEYENPSHDPYYEDFKRERIYE
ncbi:MAG: type II toxin-antitoxin system prevent-host-death family antitoxin [Defluviitaleaceae bacterium]|nr:type II toxin-antitoxin system prevent-host-death family antitoxin [Defluviitaleaceae bacterium]